MSTEIPTIGKFPKFYGYITGIGVENDGGERLLATFEYNDEVTVWIVPDERLFKLLADHLCGMAWSRIQAEEYGMNKVWIEFYQDAWRVTLP